MPIPIRDQVVVLTGASMGLGRALAHELAGEGARLVLAARSEDRLQEVAGEVRERGGQALVVPTDVTRREAVDALVERTLSEWGRIDVLINNAGYGVSALIDEMPVQAMEELFAVNVYGCVHTIQAVLAPMRRQGSGTVVNVGSVIGRRAVPAHAAYCMSKFALVALSDTLRGEVERDGLHVLHVDPGLTDTEFRSNTKAIGIETFSHPWIRPMPAATCARRIVRALRRGKRRLTVTASGKMVVLLNNLMPGLVDRILSRTLKFNKRTEVPAS